MAESPQIAHEPTLSANPVDTAEAERLPDGAKIGDYVVERWLGAGAMGEVYAGRQPVIGKRVAIKVLKRELAADKEAAERFLREARAVNQVDHPNVIDVFGFGRLDDGRLYLVMDLVDGRSLRKVLEDGPLEVEAALDILQKIADALDAAHARGVVHRDLKPDNVMVSSAGQVFVLDFGIAKLVNPGAPASNGTLTAKGTWLGSPGYMAPEQWSSDGAGPASDRYALGVMAYELLSGSLPFQAASLPQMMEQHFRAPVPSLSSRGTSSSQQGRKAQHHETIDPVLARAMAKNPDARYGTAKELVAALRTASGGTAVEVPAKKSMMIPALAGVGVLGIATIGFVVIRGGDRDHATDPPAAAPAAPGEMVKLQVITTPSQAKVTRNGALIGMTPLTADVPPGKVELAITKPGYRAITSHETLELTHDRTVKVDLQPITGFEGVWSMPDGKLRGFWRTDGDKVGIYRLHSIKGERELWRTGDLVDPPSGADKNLVVFATSTTMADERSGDHSCDDIPHKVEYRFDPTHESLEVRVEIVGTAKRDGRCIEVSREPGEPVLLARADREIGDVHYTQPPVGRPRLDVKGDKNADFSKGLDNGPGKPTSKPIQTNPPKKPVLPQKQVKPPPPNPDAIKKAELLKKESDKLQAIQSKAGPKGKKAVANDFPDDFGSKQAPPQQAPQQAPPQQAIQPQAPNGDSQQAKPTKSPVGK